MTLKQVINFNLLNCNINLKPHKKLVQWLSPFIDTNLEVTYIKKSINVRHLKLLPCDHLTLHLSQFSRWDRIPNTQNRGRKGLINSWFVEVSGHTWLASRHMTEGSNSWRQKIAKSKGRDSGCGSSQRLSPFLVLYADYLPKGGCSTRTHNPNIGSWISQACPNARVRLCWGYVDSSCNTIFSFSILWLL